MVIMVVEEDPGLPRLEEGQMVSVAFFMRRRNVEADILFGCHIRTARLFFRLGFARPPHQDAFEQYPRAGCK